MKHKNTYQKIIFMIVLFLFIIIGLYIGFCQKQNKNQVVGVRWNGQKKTTDLGNNEYIAIPCITTLVLKSNQLNQKVNFYNPEQNSCLMSFSLFINENKIWESDTLNPGYAFYDIKLNKKLMAGNYTGELAIKCFSLDGKSKLNGGKIKINIKII